MESFKIENLSFRYPERDDFALKSIDLSVNKGEFITVCGRSGCGKTTLLRMLKPSISPHGEKMGQIYFEGQDLSVIDAKTQASKIGFVMQSPENQIVTDKVWHELSFGLESLGLDNTEIRTRVSEMASFFGIEKWFHKKVCELSGGQKQILNLASVMAMQPSVLILDEPTSRLDPIAAGDFFATLKKINLELGTTVILSEHRLEEALPISDRVIVIDEGKIVSDGTPKNTALALKNREMYKALPSSMRIYGALSEEADPPVTVREGRLWLEAFSENNTLYPELIPQSTPRHETEPAIELSDVWFRYEKDSPDVIKGLSLTVKKGEIFAIVGGNGVGKSTVLSLISGLNKQYRGKILINGKKLSEHKELYGKKLSFLPQDPQSVFVKKTVYLDLFDALLGKKLTDEEKEERIKGISELCNVGHLLNYHPYDLSGGEQQRAALAKVLLQDPEILLLDEPTKAMDAYFKEEFSEILHELKRRGMTVVMVSHDIEFCAENADYCAMLFDGSITSEGLPREFFAGKSFYTTSTNRMARGVLENAVVPSDVILACGGKVPPKEKRNNPELSPKDKEKEQPKSNKKSVKRIVFGSIFALLFALSSIIKLLGYGVFINGTDIDILQILTLIFATVSLFCFFPGKEIKIAQDAGGKKLSKRTVLASLFVLIAVPLTVFFGVYFLDDRQYYVMSIAIICETLIPFLFAFENRKPRARELVIISVLCAIAVVGRAAFFMLPQFKPVVAIIIISGICLGGEAGFLVGTVTAFVSNFFFGQGPWTPWQMFTFGIIGFLAGILFKKGIIKRTRALICLYGFFAVIILYGGIMNPSSVIMAQNTPTVEMITAAYLTGLPFDIIHAFSTVFFLYFLSEEMIEKLERVKTKYGLIK